MQLVKVGGDLDANDNIVNYFHGIIAGLSIRFHEIIAGSSVLLLNSAKM